MLELFASYAKGKRDAQQRGDGSLSSYYSEKMGDCLNLMSEVAQQEAYNYAQTKYGDGNVAF